MPKLLLVEDEPNLLFTLKLWFEEQGHTVEAVDTGEAALEQLRAGNFALVILDYHLPDMDGIDVLKQYRGQGGDSLVLMMTGRKDQKSIDDAMSAGASSYLPKPCDLEKLTERVDSLLRQIATT